MTRRDQTRVVQAGIGNDPAYRAVTPPLYTSTTYAWPDIETKGPYDYGRSVNPTRDILKNAIVDLEGGTSGEITNSGMAAIDLVLNLTNADDLIIAPHDCYGGTHRLLTHRAAQGRLKVSFIDQSSDTELERAFEQKPAMIIIETPSNPLMRIVDIGKICNAARTAGAITVCDNTFLSPVRQKPLALGCDVVVHSCTKYLNGHSDVTLGAVITQDDALGETLRWWANCAGLTGAPFDAWLALRGLHTLTARMNAQEQSARAIANFLEGHERVERVYYPGLASHPDYDLAARQQSGPGAMLSFEIKGNLESAKSFLSGLKLFQLAASLGGTESLISQPALMTHAGMDKEARHRAGIKDTLIRVSVGLEHVDDLTADLEQSFIASR